MKKNVHQLIRVVASLAIMTTVAATAMASAGPPAEASTSSRTTSYRYVEGKFVHLVEMSDGRLRVIINRGSEHGIKPGASGLIYAGDSAEFLRDSQKKKVWFRVEEVSARECVVYLSGLDRQAVSANRRVTIRSAR